jgi:uncharacterized protein involved in exopolysaccharide biosynthesis
MDGGSSDPRDNPSYVRRAFRFPLPADPLRLLSNVLSKWPAILGFAALLGLAGAVVGLKMSKREYTLTCTILMRKVTKNIQVDEGGQAYRPADLSDKTLQGILTSDETLERTAQRMKNGLTAKDLRGKVEAVPYKETDFFYITYHSPISDKDAVEFMTVWIDEIIQYSKRLQQADARGLRDILQQQVAEMNLELSTYNRTILDFCRDKQYMGPDESTVIQTQMLTLQERMEHTRADLQSKTDAIKAFTEDLRKTNPYDMRVSEANAKLANLKHTYTDENPQVKVVLQEIEELKASSKKFQEDGNHSLDEYGDRTAYERIQMLEIERSSLENQLKVLENRFEEVSKRYDELPGLNYRFDELKSRRQQTLTGLQNLSKRLKETEIFATSAPGYWQRYQAPKPEYVIPTSRLKKPLVVGAAGAFFGMGLSSIGVFLLTWRDPRRSTLDACIVSRAPLMAEFIKGAVDMETFDTLWVTLFSGRLANRETILAWMPTVDEEDEVCFWKGVTLSALRDGNKPPTVYNLTPSMSDSEELRACFTQQVPAPGTACIIRANRLPDFAGRSVLGDVRFWFALATCNAKYLSRTTRASELTAAGLQECDGVITWVEKPKNALMRLGNELSTIVATQFSRVPKTVVDDE